MTVVSLPGIWRWCWGFGQQYTCPTNQPWDDSNSIWTAAAESLRWENKFLNTGIYPNMKSWNTCQFRHSVMSSSLWPHRLQHTRLPCPSPTPRAYSNSCPSNQWCHPTISSSVTPFSSHLQSFPASGSFQMSQLFTPGGQSIGVSASTSVLPMNIQDWFPLGWTGWISLQSKGLSRIFWIFCNTTVQKHEFFSAQLSLWSNCHIHTWFLEKT